MGLIIGEKINWEKHTSFVSKRLSSSIFALRKLKNTNQLKQFLHLTMELFILYKIWDSFWGFAPIVGLYIKLSQLCEYKKILKSKIRVEIHLKHYKFSQFFH